ncbi:MAG TPA: antitoxin [Streptosporangiales bacterium]
MTDEDLRKQGRQVANAFVESLGELRDGITEQTAKHEGTIKDKLGKLTGFLDERTGRRYSDKLDRARQRLDDGVGKVADRGRSSGGDGSSGSGPGSTGTSR